jgi:hypothetical protein
MTREEERCDKRKLALNMLSNSAANRGSLGDFIESWRIIVLLSFE